MFQELRIKAQKKNENEEDTVDAKTDMANTTEMVKCGKCNEEMLKNKWNWHNLSKHNNMSWLEGESPVDYEKDEKALKRTLVQAWKQRKGQLSCEKCGATKRSVSGFISHMQFCGKTGEERMALMVTCPICYAVMMPSSMETHERHHKQLEKSRKEQECRETEMAGKRKRKAAEKAVSKIQEFTDLEKNPDSAPAKKLKLESPKLKKLVKAPQLKKRIPAIVQTIWKKELASDKMAACRQPGCSFTATSLEDICKHYSQCNFIPQKEYMCKICKAFIPCEDDILKHITEKHPTYIEEAQSDFEKSNQENYSSDDTDGENASASKGHGPERTKTSNKMSFLDKEIVWRANWRKAYSPAFRWTLEFELKNFELQLFENLRPNPFVLLSKDDAKGFLPELETSMPARRIEAGLWKDENKDDGQWKRWKRFEGEMQGTVPTFFVGGPVWALAFLPIPAPILTKSSEESGMQNCPQFLAVSTHPTMTSEYTIGKSYSGANLIQIWRLGHLDHRLKIQNEAQESPSLAYAIAHGHGTVWCLEWCPSGCYENEEILGNYSKATGNIRRMGLLAAACSDGCVRIYSLPFPEEIVKVKMEEDQWPIFKTDPVFTLVVNTKILDAQKQNWQCTKLSWTKEHGHNVIAAGFSNGYIALWDLTTDSPLLKSKRGNTVFLNAFKHFYAHGHAVSMVSLIPYGGKRYLASGSIDRCFKLWDLQNTSAAQSVLKKGMITDGAWMLNWPTAITCFDDALGWKHTNSYVIPVREHTYKFFPILPSNSPTYSITVSDHGNSVAQGTLAGDVLTIFPQQILYGKDMDKILPRKRMLNSFVKIVDFKEPKSDLTSSSNSSDKEDKKKSKEYNYMPDTYAESADRFGIVFNDNLTSSKDNLSKEQQEKSLYGEKLTSVPIEQYPFMSANRVTWNPNDWSYLCLGVGYQSGFVRILNFYFMTMADEGKSLLMKHADSLLKKKSKAATS